MNWHESLYRKMFLKNKDNLFQGTIKMQKARYDDSDDFKSLIQNVNLIFCTPQLLCNHLKDTASVQLSIGIFTLLIIDYCHHAHWKSVYNELMSYYRLAKYGEGIDCLPQVNILLNVHFIERFF